MNEINLKELSLSNLACWFTKYETEFRDASTKLNEAADKLTAIHEAAWAHGCKDIRKYTEELNREQ